MTTVDLSRSAPLTDTTALHVYGAKAAGTPSLLDKGLLLPQVASRNEFYPDHPDIDGSVLRATSIPDDALGMNVRLAAATEADFDALYLRLVETVRQFSYTATVALGGFTRVYDCMPGSVTWLNQARQWFDAGLVVDYFTITCPCFPIPSS